MRCFFVLMVSSFFLSACALVSPTENKVSKVDRVLNTERILAVDNWVIDGRIAVIQPKKSWHSHLDWRHSSGGDAWQFSSLLTGTLGELHYHDGMFVIVNEKGIPELKKETEIMQMVGFKPPFEGLKYWIRGVRDPFGEAEVMFDNKGFVQSIRQQEWLVSLARYSLVNGIWLPTKISLQRGSLKIKLIVDEWT